MATSIQITDDGTLGLIRSIYDSALDAARWNDFLVGFGKAFHSEATVVWANDFSDRSVQITGGPASLGAFHGLDPAFMESFASHYCQCNVWTENEHLHQEGLIVNSSEMFPDQRLSGTEWYADWLKPQDLFYSCAAVVEKRDQRSFNVTAVRSSRLGAYSQDEMGRMRLLVPHLQTAFALHRRLHRSAALSQASLSVLDALPMGVVLLDERAQVMHVSQKAHALAESTQLLRFGTGATLRAAVHADDLRLQQAMLSAATMMGAGSVASAGTALRLRGTAGEQLHAMVAPLPRWSSPFGEGAAGAVFISDPYGSGHSLQGMLQSLYKLTPAEARLAQALVNGLTPHEYAQQQEVSIHTVRSQYKSAASKVGANRQADFVRTLLTGPAMLRWNRQQERTPPSAAD